MVEIAFKYLSKDYRNVGYFGEQHCKAKVEEPRQALLFPIQNGQKLPQDQCIHHICLDNSSATLGTEF